MTDLNEILFEKAVYLRNSGDPAAALDLLLTLKATTPEYSAVWALLGATQLDLQQRESAVQSFTRAVSLAPRSQVASLGLFHSLWGVGRELEALKEIKRFLALKDLEDYRQILAELREKRQDLMASFTLKE